MRGSGCSSGSCQGSVPPRLMALPLSLLASGPSWPWHQQLQATLLKRTLLSHSSSNNSRVSLGRVQIAGPISMGCGNLTGQAWVLNQSRSPETQEVISRFMIIVLFDCVSPLYWQLHKGLLHFRAHRTASRWQTVMVRLVEAGGTVLERIDSRDRLSWSEFSLWQLGVITYSSCACFFISKMGIIIVSKS